MNINHSVYSYAPEDYCLMALISGSIDNVIAQPGLYITSFA